MPINQLDKDTFDIMLCKAYCPEACPNRTEEKIQQDGLNMTEAFQETMIERIENLIQSGAYSDFTPLQIAEFRKAVQEPVRSTRSIDGRRQVSMLNSWLTKTKRLMGRTQSDSYSTTVRIKHNSQHVQNAALMNMTLSQYVNHMFAVGCIASAPTLAQLKQQQKESNDAKEKVQKDRRNKNNRLFD